VTEVGVNLYNEEDGTIVKGITLAKSFSEKIGGDYEEINEINLEINNKCSKVSYLKEFD